MTLRTLALVPALGALAVAVLGAASGDDRAWLVGQFATNALSFAGCVAAARAFGRRDWMFGAWTLTGLSFAIPAAWRLYGGTAALWDVKPESPALGVAVLVGVNLTAVCGSLAFVLAFVRSGLAVAVGRRAAAAELAAGLALALALGVPALVSALRIAEGPVDVFEAWLAVAADVTCFVLVAPLWRISRAFAGGTLEWPWAFLAVCNLGYLLFDAALALAEAQGGGPAAPWRVAGEAFYAASTLAGFSAAIAHRQAVAAARALARAA